MTHLVGRAVQGWLIERGHRATLDRCESPTYASVKVATPGGCVELVFTSSRVLSDPESFKVAQHTAPRLWSMVRAVTLKQGKRPSKPELALSVGYEDPDLFDLVLSYLDYRSQS